MRILSTVDRCATFERRMPVIATRSSPKHRRLLLPVNESPTPQSTKPHDRCSHRSWDTVEPRCWFRTSGRPDEWAEDRRSGGAPGSAVTQTFTSRAFHRGSPRMSACRRNCRCHLETMARRAVAMEVQTRSLVFRALHEPIPGLDTLPLLANTRAIIAGHRKT